MEKERQNAWMSFSLSGRYLKLRITLTFRRSRDNYSKCHGRDRRRATRQTNIKVYVLFRFDHEDPEGLRFDELRHELVSRNLCVTYVSTYLEMHISRRQKNEVKSHRVIVSDIP